LKKAEMLLKMEELPKPEKDKNEVYLPPALPLPFRFEHTTTTVNDLIEALERALTERTQTAKPNLPTLPLPIPDFLDAEDYLLEIENRSDTLFEEIKWRFDSTGSAVRITELIYGLDFLEIVRIFMMLLFLAQRMRINLTQSEEEIDINITIMEEELQIG
jgi:chromatin segregation and condensation protein Rec8/ScpA/Scc1 (kleisin family)